MAEAGTAESEKRPLGTMLSLTTSPTSSDAVSRSMESLSGNLQALSATCRRQQAGAVHTIDTAAVGDSMTSGGMGDAAGRRDSSVTTPCFSSGMRSPVHSPAANALPLRPTPQRFAAHNAVSGDAEDRRVGSGATQPPGDAETAQRVLPEASRSASLSENAFAGTQRIPLCDDNNDVGAATAAAQEDAEDSGDNDMRKEEEEDDDEQKAPSRGESTESGQDSNFAGSADTLRSSEAKANADVARALAMFSRSIQLDHPATMVPDVNGSGSSKPSLPRDYSYMPWRLPDSDGTASEAPPPSTGNDGQGGAPLPPELLVQRSAEKTRVRHSQLGSSSDSGAGACPTTTPVRGLSAAVSNGSDPAVLDSGSSPSSGVADAEAAASVAALGIPAARFGGGGVLRQNPGYLAFSGSGSGSQAGEGAIDRSLSSHLSLPSRGPAALSPPFLVGDEENGELAVAFRRDGLSRERQQGGSPGARGIGAQQPTPSHFEFTNSLDETFGTLVSTMSTTYSATTNSLADTDPSSSGDTHRSQLAAQMRQALMQTLGLSNSGAGAGGLGKQRSERALSLASTLASNAEALTPSGVVMPLTPMHEVATGSAQGYVPRLPQLGHGAGVTSVSATPPVSARNGQHEAAYLAFSASISTNSTTSPTVAAGQTHTVAALFAAIATPSPRRPGVAGDALHESPSAFDGDSTVGDEEAGEREGRRGGERPDALHNSLSEANSRMMSASVSNPLVGDEFLSSEIGSSLHLSAAVQPPPSLQLAARPDHRGLAGMLAEAAAAEGRSPVSIAPSLPPSRANYVPEELFSNSTSSLLPPVLQSTARGSAQTAVEAAAAEAMREVGSDYYTATDTSSYAAAPPPPPLMLLAAAYDRSPRDSDASTAHASSTAGISPLTTEGARYLDEAARRHGPDSVAPARVPSAEPAAVVESAPLAEVVAALPLEEANAAAASADRAKQLATPAVATAAGAAAAAATCSAVASPVAGLEWSSHSLSLSGRTRQGRGGDGLFSVDDDDEVTGGTATTRAPNSTSSSQFPNLQTGSVTFDETPELLLDSSPIGFHPRRDGVNSFTSISLISGPQSHVDPTAGGGTAPSPHTVTGMPAQPSSRPGSTATTTTTNNDLSASTSTRMWTEGCVANAPPVLRRGSVDDTSAQGSVDSPLVAQPPLRAGPFSAVPLPQIPSVVHRGHPPVAPQPQGRQARWRAVVSSGRSSGDSTANVFGENVDESDSNSDEAEQDEEDMWGELTTAPQLPTAVVPATEEGGAGDDEDEFAEATVAPPASSVAKHVAFADPAEVQVAEPWADSDFFYAPDYTYMEFKNIADSAVPPCEADDSTDGVSEEDREILRDLPHFRFKHRCAESHGSPLLPSAAAALRAPSWDAWTRSKKPAAPDSANGAAAAAEGGETGATAAETDDAPAERAPRVFFTKERLASRAALMEARRTSSITAGSSVTRIPAAPSAALPNSAVLPALAPPPASSSSSAGLRIQLPPPHPGPTAAAEPTIAVVLPDFAAPVTSAAAPTGGLLSKPPPPPASTGNDAGDEDDDDGFGGWVQQTPVPPPAPTRATTAAAALTKERCVQLAAELARRGEGLEFPAEGMGIDTAHADRILRTIFGEQLPADSAAPWPPVLIAAASPPCPAVSSHDGEEGSEALSATTSTVPATPGESVGVDRVLEALSFTSLTQRGTAASTSPVAAGPGNTSLHAAPVIENSGYVVPWRTRTSADTTSAADAGAAKDEEGQRRAADQSVAETQEARLRLTRHLLFPATSKPDDSATATPTVCSVSAYMGSRRLPDAPTAAQWTERDVLLAVQQEQRRMAQENDVGAETERLEDVLRLSL